MAAQFTSEGATLSGVDLELVGGGYRMSLVKRRFATGSALHPSMGVWEPSRSSDIGGRVETPLPSPFTLIGMYLVSC